MSSESFQKKELSLADRITLSAQKAVALACNIPFDPESALKKLEAQEKTALRFNSLQEALDYSAKNSLNE